MEPRNAMDLDSLKELLARASTATGTQYGLEDQLARANVLRDTPLPTPTADLSYTNPLQHIARGLNQVRGERQAGKAVTGLSKAKEQLAQADSGKTLYDLQTTADDRAADVDFRNLKEDNVTKRALTLATQKREDADLAHRRAVAEQMRKEAVEAGQSSELKPWYNKDTKEFVNAMQIGKNKYVDENNQPVSLVGYLPYTASKTGKGSGSGADNGEMDLLLKRGAPKLFGDILRNENLGAATGPLDPRRWAAENLGMGEKTQAVQGKIDLMTAQTVGEYLEGLGANPTDADLQLALSALPNKDTHPYGWAVYGRDSFYPVVERLVTEAVENGSATPEAGLQTLEQLRSDINYALGTHAKGKAPLGGITDTTDTTGGIPEGYELQEDALGNMAYVGPNGEVIEVPARKGDVNQARNR